MSQNALVGMGPNIGLKKFDWHEKGFKCSEMDFDLIFADNKCLFYTRLGDLNSLYKALSLNYFEVDIVNQELTIYMQIAIFLII